jgi:hypothetical protein
MKVFEATTTVLPRSLQQHAYMLHYPEYHRMQLKPLKLLHSKKVFEGQSSHQPPLSMT